MANAYPEWKPEEDPRYDEVMDRTCAVEMAALAKADKAALVAYLRDTPPIHQRLYVELAPADHPEYAGTYRGTPGGPLADRQASVMTSTGKSMPLTPPERVAPALALVGRFIDAIANAPDDEPPETSLERAVKSFRFYGHAHPFLDGNGHVQRLLFVAAIKRFARLRLKPEWTIHPRPYDVEMRDAFEATGDGEPLKSLLEVLRPYVEFDPPAPAQVSAPGAALRADADEDSAAKG